MEKESEEEDVAVKGSEGEDVIAVRIGQKRVGAILQK